MQLLLLVATSPMNTPRRFGRQRSSLRARKEFDLNLSRQESSTGREESLREEEATAESSHVQQIDHQQPPNNFDLNETSHVQQFDHQQPPKNFDLNEAYAGSPYSTDPYSSHYHGQYGGGFNVYGPSQQWSQPYYPPLPGSVGAEFGQSSRGGGARTSYEHHFGTASQIQDG
jgi:hypothetical protein